MTHAVENMAFAGQVPWHGLGNSVSNDLSPEDMLKAAGLDWQVVKRPLYHKMDDGKMQIIDGEYSLVRSSDESVLSLVGSKYKPIQNEQAFEFFQRFVAAGKMKMETAGSLWNGKYVWGLARIGKDFKLGAKDEVRGYVLLAQPHIFGKAMIIMTTAIRVVCWNTMTFAMNSGVAKFAADMDDDGDEEEVGGIFRLSHSTKFDEAAQELAADTLGMATKQMGEFQETAEFLASKRFPADNEEIVHDYFGKVFKWDPKEAEHKKDGTVRVPPKVQACIQALTHAPGQKLNTADGTWWGAFNAVTNIVDHELGRDRQTALKQAWFGGPARAKKRALVHAIDLAKKADDVVKRAPAPRKKPAAKKTAAEAGVKADVPETDAA